MTRSRQYFPFGDLNPINPRTTAQRLDLNNTDALDAIRLAAQDFYTPDAFESLSELRGIVLRVEGKDGNNPEPEANSWYTRIFGGEKPTEVPKAYKIRIPELHAMLPEPAVYGNTPGPHQRIIDMYPTFIAAGSDVGDAAAGDIVRCDFGNRKTLEDPIFLGRISSFPFGPIDDHNAQNTIAQTKRAALATNAPDGDPLGEQIEGSQLPSLGQIQQSQQNLNVDQLEEDEHSNPEQDISGYPTAARFEDTYRFERKTGQIEVFPLPSQYASKPNVVLARVVRDAFISMAQAAARDGVRLKVNSGFRTMAQQRALFRRYGSPRAAKPGNSRHQDGTSLDINTSRSVYSAEFKWLSQNAHRFGFVNSGRTFRNNPEWWHWSYVGTNNRFTRAEASLTLKQKQAAFL